MSGLRRVAAVVTALFMALVSLVFVLENQQSVSLSFVGWATGQMPVSVFMVAALIVGMLIGPLLGVFVRSHRRSNLVERG